MRTILGVVVSVFTFATVATAAEPPRREQPAKPGKAVKLTKSELALITAGAHHGNGTGTSNSNSNSNGNSNNNNNNNNNNNTSNNSNNPPATAP